MRVASSCSLWITTRGRCGWTCAGSGGEEESEKGKMEERRKLYRRSRLRWRSCRCPRTSSSTLPPTSRCSRRRSTAASRSPSHSLRPVRGKIRKEPKNERRLPLLRLGPPRPLPPASRKRRSGCPPAATLFSRSPPRAEICWNTAPGCAAPSGSCSTSCRKTEGSCGRGW